MTSLGPITVGVFEGKGGIDKAKNPLSSSNSNYISLRYHFLGALAASGDISVKNLPQKISMRTFSRKTLVWRVRKTPRLPLLGQG